MSQSKSTACTRLCQVRALLYNGVNRLSLSLPILAFSLVGLSKAKAQLFRPTQSDLLRAAQAEQLRLETILNLRNQALRQATDAATEADRARSNLMTHISHDLRAPMNAIMGYADLVARRNGRSRVHALGILRSSRSMLMQINGLVQGARGGAQPQALQREPLYLSDFLQSVAAFATQVAHRNGNRFRCQAAKALPDVVEVDARRLRQVLEHLLANAAEFTCSGCIELSVDCQAPVDLSQSMPLDFVFTVRDTGPGIPEEILATIFEPFQRPGHTWRQECRGLGLAITHQWVLRMGGRMEVSTQPGKGTAMHVFLPLMPSSTAQVPHPLFMPDEGAVHRIEGAGRLLWIVDDSDVIRDLLCKDLVQHGFTVLALSSGLDVIKRVGQHGEKVPDLIITDLKMPDADGLAVLSSARAKWPHLPVVLMTSSPEAVTGDAHGFSAVLAKPLGRNLTYQTLGRLLAARAELEMDAAS